MTIRKDLKDFQQDLVAQLSQDVGRLQAERVQLLSDIAQLRQEKDELNDPQQPSLSRQQMAQQQLWAKQLAQALATRLYQLLADKIQHDQLTNGQAYRQLYGTMMPSGASGPQTEQAIASLDTAVNHMLTSLSQDLDSYQSSLAQQISRMQSLEHQGEAILDALVSRLNQQLQRSSAASPAPLQGHTDAPGYGVQQSTGFSGGGYTVSDRATPVNDTSEQSSSAPESSPQTSSNGANAGATQSESAMTHAVKGAIAPPASMGVSSAPAEVSPEAARPNALRDWFVQIPAFQRGLILILLSTMALSLHNVVVGIIGNASRIFNIWDMGGFISLNSLDSSLLILWLRMIVVMPLMAIISSVLYPATWSDIKEFAVSNNRTLLRNVIGSGIFLFLSQVLIYIAIGQIGPGVAVTILFMYPIMTVPMAWFLFGDRPTKLRLLVMAGICTGVVLTALPNLGGVDFSLLGVGTAMLAGVAFACYLISMQLSFRRMHPVPVSVIQFFTIFALTSIILLMRPANVESQSAIGLIVGGVVLGTLTLVGYLLNNFGVRFMGAARASIIASSGPVLTALLAFVITPGPKTQLQTIQIFGILIVTFGVTALALERLWMQRRANRQASG
ncbi:MAG: EamA family transporter [Elainellaceae cyanobacterium]